MPKSNELLRTKYSNIFEVRSCDIIIEVRHDLKTADYIYKYTISKAMNGDNEWREVFAYPIEDVEILYAKDINGNGLSYTLDTLDTPSRNTCLLIKFGKSLELGSEYYFEYKCYTKIEAISNTTFLGGNGCIVFWCAHEFPCHTIRVLISFPKGVTSTAAHPAKLSGPKNKTLVFERRGLVPREFFSAVVIYEKRLLGIPPRIGRLLGKIAWIVLGAILSLLLTILWLSINNK